MVDYVSTNALSMLGGDDFSDISTSIAVLDASVVHKTGNLTESINGVKTFVSNVNVNSNLSVANANTTITATGTASDGLITLTATDPLVTGLYGQVQAYADTKIQMKINASNSQVVLGSTDVSVYGDTTNTTTKNTETHNIGELSTLTSGTFDVTDLVTTNKLLTLNDNYVKLQAPNFGGQLDIAGSLCHFDGVPSGTNALYFGSIEPFNTIGFQNTNLQILNTDIGITQDATNTAGRSIGISVLSTCVGDLVFSLFKRTSASFLTGSGFRWVRENATSNFLFQRRAVSSGGLGTNTTIQTITFDGATETFTAPTQNKVASTAFNVTDGTINHLAITPTLTTETNATITNVASTAFKVQGVAGTDIITTTAGTQVTINPTTTLQLRINSSDVFLANGTTTTLTGATNLNLNATAGAGIVTMNISGSAKQIHTSVISTFANSTITNIASTEFKVQNILGTDKVNVASALTTLTNTNIDLVGKVNATSYNIGTNASNIPLVSWQLPGTATANAAASTITWTPSYGATSANPLLWYVFPFKIVLYAVVFMFDDDATATGNVVLTFNTKTSNAGASSTKRTQTIAWAASTTDTYAQSNLMTGTIADNTYSVGDFLKITYTGAPPANEWGIILYGYQL